MKFEVVKNAGMPPPSKRNRGKGETALAILALKPGEALRFTWGKDETFKQVYARISATRQHLTERKEFTVRKWDDNAIGVWRLATKPVAEVRSSEPKAMRKGSEPVAVQKKNGKVKYETNAEVYKSRNCSLCKIPVPLALNHKEHIQNVEIGYSDPSNIVPCQHK